MRLSQVCIVQRYSHLHATRLISICFKGAKRRNLREETNAAKRKEEMITLFTSRQVLLISSDLFGMKSTHARFEV